jgi:hypothetical protein
MRQLWNVPFQPMLGERKSLSIVAMIHRLVMRELLSGQRMFRLQNAENRCVIVVFQTDVRKRGFIPFRSKTLVCGFGVSSGRKGIAARNAASCKTYLCFDC